MTDIELYAIGTEIVYGLTNDTNTVWMTQQLLPLGWEISRVTKLRDSLEDIVSSFQASVEREARFVISTGGLGSTSDDLTATALATLAHCPLVTREDIIEDYMLRRDIPTRADVPPNLVKMATVPEKATTFRNEVGWAPGLRLDMNGTRVYILPGPPRELKDLFLRCVLPDIGQPADARRAGMRVLVSVPRESLLAPYLERLREKFPGSYLKAHLVTTPKEGWLPVDLLVPGESSEQAKANLAAMLKLLERMLAQGGYALDVDGGSFPRS